MSLHASLADLREFDRAVFVVAAARFVNVLGSSIVYRRSRPSVSELDPEAVYSPVSTSPRTDAPFIRRSQPPNVSERVPERPRANFLAALNVRRNAVRGFGFGLLATATVFALFVLVPGSRRATPYYLALGFVLALSLGALATTVLTLLAAYRLAKDEDVT